MIEEDGIQDQAEGDHRGRGTKTMPSPGFVEEVREWYLAYRSLLTLCATISVGILVFSVTFVLRDALSIDEARQAVGRSLRALELSWLLLLVSSAAATAASVSNYKWYAAALSLSLGRRGLADNTDNLQFYTSPRSMRRWGVGSVVLGWIAGVALLAGTALFVLSAILIIRGIYSVA